MKFHEKLRQRVQELGLNKAKAARDVGLPDSTINNYLAKNDSLPRIDIAAKIAKAIRVPLEWLADDAAVWPPPDLSCSYLSDRELMQEVDKRQRVKLLRVRDAIDAAKKIDWDAVQAGAAEKPPDSIMLEIMPAIDFYRDALMRHNTEVVARDTHSIFDVAAIMSAIGELYQKQAFMDAATRAWLTPSSSSPRPNFPTQPSTPLPPPKPPTKPHGKKP